MPLTETQRTALVYLGLHGRSTANDVGHELANRDLLKTTGTPSNYSLAGSSVLRSLAKLGLVTGFFDATEGRSYWVAVRGWKGKS